MIDLAYIRSFYPPNIANNSHFDRFLLKEYLQLMILDYLTTTPHIGKVVFIGGTNLRLIHGINRFSEDLDFDCTDMDQNDFMSMTNDIVEYIRRCGINVETRDRTNPKLTAYRRNLFFPQLLFDMGLTGHRDERFLIKVEAQDQGFVYHPINVSINKLGFFFSVPVPPNSVLCAMKLSALISRQKGRDFYDCMFLLSKTQPDYNYLQEKLGISSLEELKMAVAEVLIRTDFEHKKQDFLHLLFNISDADRILKFADYIDSL